MHIHHHPHHHKPHHTWFDSIPDPVVGMMVTKALYGEKPHKNSSEEKIQVRGIAKWILGKVVEILESSHENERR